MDEEKNLNTAETPETPSEQPAEKGKGKKEKAPKESKADKKAAKDAKKEKAQLQKDWENSIVTNKRVKREEMRRKLKRAMLFMLVVALIITSVVYIMLLFLDENNVRITASSTKGKKISLSMDNEIWSPYLNGKGPKNMIDLSYNPVYDREHIPTTDEVYDILMSPDTFEPGSKQKEGYICFAFMLRNDSDEDAALECEMTLEYDDVRNLQNCVRVMWGTSTRKHPENASINIYASLSQDYKLYGTDINRYREEGTGFIEYVAYPLGSDEPYFDLVGWETELFNGDDYYENFLNGYFATEPFYSDDYVFKYEDTLEANDILYCYICIWIEGSDFDCTDAAIGGYVKMNINFTAY